MYKPVVVNGGFTLSSSYSFMSQYYKFLSVAATIIDTRH